MTNTPLIVNLLQSMIVVLALVFFMFVGYLVVMFTKRQYQKAMGEKPDNFWL